MSRMHPLAVEIRILKHHTLAAHFQVFNPGRRTGINSFRFGSLPGYFNIIGAIASPSVS